MPESIRTVERLTYKLCATTLTFNYAGLQPKVWSDNFWGADTEN